ncbi:MAG: uroporphyrinogen-III C-methyltransferase [Bacteroidota bacterium]|nr:uroporphyrinogen-III C-methyltransferase [Bacteroidota bacterium]MDP3146630.1 uroporphyrinogen-III C-methyltransferase [Bacteroidota bacterium]MDP3556203.1 uroporphyrinogen-III C-methyltransferase [Bacteroidota bacterium]
MSQIVNPKLTLVGAGPGDVELITIKGLNALKQANVVLYDALVNKELLKFAPNNALKIYVGKRNNQHAYTQDQINSLIIDLAFTHGHVVRLKGGDSFVFGRGQEEIDYAYAFNIETEVIPGISSSIGVPALSGIPVTHRGISESFWVITGTTKENNLSQDVVLSAKTNATVVILMGLSKLKEITEVFKKENKGNTAVALIQNGSLPNQKIALGVIETIVGISEKENIEAPAVIVIGEVVKLHREFTLSRLNSRYLFN